MKCPNCKKGILEETEFSDQVYCPECETIFDIQLRQKP